MTVAASVAGSPSVAIPVPPGVTQVGIGVVGLTDAVLRVELGLWGRMQDSMGLRWFDTGTGLDLSAAEPFRLVPVAGVAAVRLAVRTAADELGEVYVGPMA